MTNPGPASIQQTNTGELLGVRLTPSEFANPSAAILANTNIVYQQSGVGGIWQSNGTSLVQITAVSGGGNLVRVLGQQHTAQNKSDADANESAALFTLDIPANTLGPNSTLRVRTLWTVPSSAATKRLRGRFGGVVLWNLDLSTHLSYALEFVFSNRNSVSSQIAQGNNLSWAVALASTAVQTFSVDFSTAQQLTITAQWPVAGSGSNNITLESVLVQHSYGA